MNRIRTLIFFMLFACTNGVIAQEPPALSLNGEWTLSYWPQPEEAITSPEEMKKADVKQITAQVPGNVELDLFSCRPHQRPYDGQQCK